jgi:histidyl-tRNA synthetase
MEIRAIRGMHDLLGEEIARWNYVEEKVRSLFAAFGYQEVRTPVLEKIEVFTHTVGDETDIVEKQMYNVQAGEEKLVLRPEGTSSFIRAVVEHQLHRTGQPQRYYYYLPMFRHERPQKGRLRQFHQFGAEFINDPSPEADAELIVLLDHLYKMFGITEYEIRINSVGCADCRPLYKKKLQDYFRPFLPQLCEQCQKRFERAPMRILDCKREECKALAKGAPTILENLDEKCATHHAALKRRLEGAKVSYIEDANIVRGLDYYSRTAFEFTSSLLGAQSALGGGGRYDGMSAQFGEAPFPAVGWGLGMERLMMVLEEKKALPDVKKKPLAYLAPLGEAAYELLYPLSLSLKRKGVWAEMNYDKGKSLKSLLKSADRVGGRFTVMVGDNELKEGKALLKNMADGTQETVPLDTLEEALIRRSQLAT